MERETRNQLRRLAEHQRGLFSAAQAAQLGVSYTSLNRAVANGYLRHPRQGVYGFTGSPVSPWDHVIAAALRAGPEAVVSHSTAASAHRLLCASPLPSLIELTVPAVIGRRLQNVTVHRRSPLTDDEWVTKHGIRVTTPLRTLFDLSPRLGLPLLERTLDEGLLRRQWAVGDIRRSLAKAPSNLPGRAALRHLVALRAESPTAESALEARAFRALRRLEPFEAHHQVRIGRDIYLIDAAWPRYRVGAEIVGRHHRVVSRSAFDRERRKLNALVAAGWRIAHLTAAMSAQDMFEAVKALLCRRDNV